MEAERFARVVELMARMSAGDAAATFVLYEEFGTSIAARLRRELARVGVPFIAREELDSLVIEACLEINEVASGWDPAAGVLPWTWAWRRIRLVVDRHVGMHTDPLSPAQDEQSSGEAGEGPGREQDAGRLLDDLGERGPLCGLLRDALGEVASNRDRMIFLEVKLQTSLGDPSPARTVGEALGLRAEAVRQVVHRVRSRLRALAINDDRYAAIADLPILR